MKDLCKLTEILESPSLKLMVSMIVGFFMLAEATRGILFAEKIIGYASWYSVESCKREGTSGIMANGKELNDEDYICASWDYPFGTRLLVRNFTNGKEVIVTVTDRGPSKRLYKQGRIIDLSKRAFSEIADLKWGIIKVKVEVIK